MEGYFSSIPRPMIKLFVLHILSKFEAPHRLYPKYPSI